MDEYYRQKPLHVPGAPDKFVETFSWDTLNELLSMTTLWSDQTLELAINGRSLVGDHYCYAGTDRDNEKTMNADFARVHEFMRQGATLTLNFIERLTPPLRSLSQTLAAVLCAPVNCSTFCSWHKAQGYPSHFDITQVFVCQIAGEKRWRIYQGRMPGAGHTEGANYTDYPQDYHERAKGPVMMELVMKPGDLLYLPHGQYHDAVAESGESLHLSFAVRHMLTQDFINTLSIDLPKDLFFRQHMPQIDDEDEGYRRDVANRLQEIMLDPKIGEGLHQFLQAKAFERFAEFSLPSRENPIQYRVRWLGKRMVRRGQGWKLDGKDGAVELDAIEGAIAEWVIARDYFSDDWLGEDLPDIEPDAYPRVLDKLETIGLIAQI